MITCKCETKDTALLATMQPFQGELKKRTDKDIEAMKASILSEGLLMPLALWHREDGNYILDGHGRYAALIKAALSDVSILEQPLPVVMIEAADEDTAKKALLQITSSYGKVTSKGLATFTASIPNYKAPIISSVKVSKPTAKAEATEYKIVRLKVPTSKYSELIKIFKDIKWVEVY
jgi:hypothetical protein